MKSPCLTIFHRVLFCLQVQHAPRVPGAQDEALGHGHARLPPLREALQARPERPPAHQVGCIHSPHVTFAMRVGGQGLLVVTPKAMQTRGGVTGQHCWMSYVNGPMMNSLIPLGSCSERGVYERKLPRNVLDYVSIPAFPATPGRATFLQFLHRSVSLKIRYLN